MVVLVQKVGWLACCKHKMLHEDQKRKNILDGWLLLVALENLETQFLLASYKKKEAGRAKKREELNFSKRSLSKTNLCMGYDCNFGDYLCIEYARV